MLRSVPCLYKKVTASWLGAVLLIVPSRKVQVQTSHCYLESLNQDFPTAVMINCCFCVDLRKGCIIVGILDMVNHVSFIYRHMNEYYCITQVLYSLILATNCMQLIDIKWQLTERILIRDIDSWDEELDCSGDLNVQNFSIHFKHCQ